MLRLLYKYLILNKKATVPGLGVFYIDRKPAKLDFANKVFTAPALEINFKDQLLVADNAMLAVIGVGEKLDEREALSDINDFSDQIQKSLKEHNSLELPGLGVISQNAEGKISFKPTNILRDYFPDVAAKRIIREHVEHSVLVGDINKTNTEMKEMFVEDTRKYSGERDNWWIFAVGLGVIGVATIVYYYLHHGSLH